MVILIARQLIDYYRIQFNVLAVCLTKKEVMS
ncbi:MAG: hypothetical protein DDT23_01145 [candidate division WS2 bacterium]|nr:hypothetical protein [Candidatus Lithacetigena glycinireducens]